MAFTSDIEEYEKEHADENEGLKNPYLKDPSRGLELVSRLISGKGSKRSRENKPDDIGRLVDKIFSYAGIFRVEDEIAVSSELRKLLDLLKLPLKYRLLEGKTVVGVGGRFSAGKSEFLNSLFDGAELMLPVHQNPSTSVATYIMKDSSDWAAACANRGECVPLDAQALAAISHDFWKVHGLGLAQYIKFLAVGTERFPADGVALLDTPGYNKADGRTLLDYTDRQRALSELRSADRLIWLIDVTNGTMTQDDIDFIRGLGEDGRSYDRKMLIVVNKCDLRDVGREQSPDDSPLIKEISDKALDSGLNAEAIVPYSAVYPDWNGGRERVKNFLTDAANDEHKTADISSRAAEILDYIERSADSALNVQKRRSRDAMKAVDKALNPLEVRSLASARGMMNRTAAIIEDRRAAFKKDSACIMDWIKRQLGTA